MIGFGQVIHDSIDIGFGIFGTMDIQMLVSDNVHRIRNIKMIPQKFVERGVFVNPQNFMNRNDGIAVRRRHNKIMLCDKHVLRCKLWQSCKFFFGLCKHLGRMPENNQVLAWR